MSKGGGGEYSCFHYLDQDGPTCSVGMHLFTFSLIALTLFRFTHNYIRKGSGSKHFRRALLDAAWASNGGFLVSAAQTCIAVANAHEAMGLKVPAQSTALPGELTQHTINGF